jgi:hypothetical protein
VFGHTSWLSRFEGYPVDFQPVTIGRSVSIAWGVFLLPGTVVEDGAVVGARSVVSRRIPPRCLAVGYPARIVAGEPDFPRAVPEAEKEAIFSEIVAEAVGMLEAVGARCTRDGDRWRVTTRRRRWGGGLRTETFTAVRTAWPETMMEAGPCADVLVSLRAIPGWLRRHLDGCGTLWIDIESKQRADAESELAEAILLTFRRHGVRLFRTPPEAVPGPAEACPPGRQHSYQ